MDAFIKASKPENFKSRCGYQSAAPMVVASDWYLFFSSVLSIHKGNVSWKCSLTQKTLNTRLWLPISRADGRRVRLVLNLRFYIQYSIKIAKLVLKLRNFIINVRFGVFVYWILTFYVICFINVIFQHLIIFRYYRVFEGLKSYSYKIPQSETWT